MEDISVKTNTPNPANGAGASAASLKDAGNSPADALALAFNQFLRKAAAKPDQILAGTRGQIIPFQFALGSNNTDSSLDRAGFEPADEPMSRPDAAPAPNAPRDSHRSPTSNEFRPTNESVSASRESSAPSPAHEDNESLSADAQTGNAVASTRAEMKSDGTGRQAQLKGQSVESMDGDDRLRGRKKKSVGGTTKEQAETFLAGLVVSLKPGQGAEHANDHAEGSAEQANDPSNDSNGVTGIANALTQLGKQARGQIRSGSTQEAEGTQAVASGADIEAAAEGDSEAARKAGASIETRARQAAELAERIGAGARMSVQVEVTDEANSLMSRPTAALLAAHDEKVASAADARLGLRTTTAMNEQASSAAIQSEGAEAVAERFAALAGVSGLNMVAQASAVTDESAQQFTTQGVAPGGGASARATEAPTQSNAAQNAQRPATNFRSEVLEQVSVTIQKAIKDGADRITVQLRPAELGRIDVRIEVASDGRTLVHVAADRSDTLDLLQRDARDLARALQDAGLRADAGNLQFSLREQAAENRNQRGRSGAAKGANLVENIAADAGSVPAWTPTVRPGRVDIRA